MPGGNYKTKKLIFISVAMFLAAIFASIPLATNGEHCDAHTKDSKDVLCLENQYPKIPLPKMGNTSLFDKGPYSLNDIAEKVKTPFNTIDPLSGLIYYLFTFSVSVVGIIAFGAIIYAGVMLMMSGARPQLRMDAKNKIRNVILGIALLLGSVILLNTINPELSIINVPGADKGSGLKFDLPEGKECAGAGSDSAFEMSSCITFQQIADSFCPPDKNIEPPDPAAVRFKLGSIAAYTQEDVDKVFSIINEQSLCPGTKITVSGPSGDISLTGNVPRKLCTYTGVTFEGLVGEAFRIGGNVPDAFYLQYCLDLTKNRQENIQKAEDKLRNKISEIVSYCGSTTKNEPYCSLTDPEKTSLGSFTTPEQQGALSEYCLDIVRLNCP